MEKFVLRVCKSLGLVPFNHTQPSASFIDYILMLLLPIGYVASFIFTLQFSENLALVQKCQTICAPGHYMFMHLGMFLFLWSFLLNITKRDFYLQFNHAVRDIENELLKCNLKILGKELKYRKLRSIFIIGNLIFFCIGSIFDSYHLFMMAELYSPLLVIAYSFPFLIGCFVQMQFITFINIIGENFERLNSILETICSECDKRKNYRFKLFDIETDFIQKNTLPRKQIESKAEEANENKEDNLSENTERYLVNVFRIHNKLYQAGVTANRAYSVQTVCYMTVAFIIIVFGIFLETKVVFLVGGINRYLDYMAHSYALWGVSLAAVAYIVLRLCCKVQNEAKRSALLVHEIMQRKPAFMLGNDIYYNRMKCFTLQYLHWENYFHFNGVGLFHLDYTFIFSAISAATSYLIVLLQFDLTSEVQKG